MKKCFKCGIVKPLDAFYEHKMMRDGRLNKCISCTKNDVKERQITLIENDPNYLNKERLRGRDKYKRLYSGSTSEPATRKKSSDNYKNTYPEKQLAKNSAACITCPEGFHKHHWSYNNQHFKDVIIIPSELHYKLHRFLQYDLKEKMYRTPENTLLDSRELHECFIEIVKQIF